MNSIRLGGGRSIQLSYQGISLRFGFEPQGYFSPYCRQCQGKTGAGDGACAAGQRGWASVETREPENWAADFAHMIRDGAYTVWKPFSKGGATMAAQGDIDEMIFAGEDYAVSQR